MSKLRPPLGRGLDALIRPNGNQLNRSNEHYSENSSSNENPSEGIHKIPISSIDPNPFQPRTEFDQTALDELKQSIISNGLIQPITVRKWGERYQLISGERRWRAFTQIGYSEIPAYIIEVASDELMIAMALIENIQRERLNPIEVAVAYKKLMDECKLTQEEISERVGKERSTIANSIRLLKLPLQIQESLIKEDISMGHARALVNLPSVTAQLSILKQIKEEGLSVRKVEALVKQAIEGTDTKPASKNKVTSHKHDIDAGIQPIVEKLQRVFGTKVLLKQKSSGGGEIQIEFYSLDDFDRLLELFDLIEKNNS